MKYFITGISGFIGSNLARKLLREGHQINALVRDMENINLFKHPGLKFIKGSLKDRKTITSAMKGCNTAFHLAAFAKPWAKDPNEYIRVNIDGSKNVFEAAKIAGVKKVVFTSSAATMSPSISYSSSDEMTPRNIPLFNEYEITKKEAELIACEYSRNSIPIVIVNPSRVFGPGPLNASNSVTKMILQYCLGKWRIIPGNGERIGNYVFVDDVVSGHLLAANYGNPGERYILGGENLSFNDFFFLLRNITGQARKMIKLPLQFMSGIAWILEKQYFVTGIPPVITPPWIKKYLCDWSLSSRKAMSDLGYQITPVRDGIIKTLEWLFASGLLHEKMIINKASHPELSM